MNTEEKLIYENIINNLSDGVLVIGFDGKINICNPAACEILDIEPGFATGKSIANLMLEFEENDDFFELLLDAVYMKKKTSKLIPFMTKESIKYLNVTTTLLVEEGKSTALIAVLSDHTELANLFIKNKKLATQVTSLMNSFVEVMVTAIEEKSTYNANHTKNMVKYASNYIEWMATHKERKNISSKNEPLIMSVWLHDIGKLLIPPEVMDKPTRLGNEIIEIKHRIETSRLMFKIRFLSGEISEEQFNKEISSLDECEKLINYADTAPFLDDAKVKELNAIASHPCIESDGESCPLLNADELEAITITKGTLTREERNIIESHARLTGKLLSKMTFVGDYKNVPSWASGHHEYLDGSGYPNKLKESEIPWETRLITIIDIYDALTAEDRPYKKPMPSEKAFAILNDMANEGKLDKEILHNFYESGAWKKAEDSSMNKLTIDARKENLNDVLTFIDGFLEELNTPQKTIMQVDLSAEEIFANISEYAYGDGKGQVTVVFKTNQSKDEISITFIDSGIHYNPLEKEDPDITLSIEERKIGGLGVFLIKKYMDDVTYEYKDYKNHLTITKKLF
ncbi:MAG: ATP-binding protein [Lachnospiraceae bacterium]|nr:ATP-binding protein [Lachnospiraceae bacterium]